MIAPDATRKNIRGSGNFSNISLILRFIPSWVLKSDIWLVHSIVETGSQLLTSMTQWPGKQSGSDPDLTWIAKTEVRIRIVLLTYYRYIALLGHATAINQWVWLYASLYFVHICTYKTGVWLPCTSSHQSTIKKVGVANEECTLALLHLHITYSLISCLTWSNPGQTWINFKPGLTQIKCDPVD